MDEKPLVSIRCTVYNHEPFLRQCLDGFVMQKTNFKFEAIVHDDASTDRSADIIREYANNYPNIIHPIFEKTNQWSKGSLNLIKILDNAERGTYIAICEGDDYWTDPLKLQRQVDFLNSNTDYSAVAENGMILYTSTNTMSIFNNDNEHDISISELIEKRRFPTASVMYRKGVMNSDFYDIKYLQDTVRWCYLASKGKIKYFENVSSVYRRGKQGITEYTDAYIWSKRIENMNLELIHIFGNSFDKNIALDNIYNQYLGAFVKYVVRRTFNKNMFLCLFKCLEKHPIRFIVDILNIKYKNKSL
jgi:glycosyltransferase involved in cell wall biosynthesis